MLIRPIITNQPTDDDYHAYAEALSEGTRLRDRAKHIHDAVHAGQMTAAQATALAQYPTEHAITAHAMAGGWPQSVKYRV